MRAFKSILAPSAPTRFSLSCCAPDVRYGYVLDAQPRMKLCRLGTGFRSAQSAMVALRCNEDPILNAACHVSALKSTLKARILQREIATRYWRCATRLDTFSNPLKD